MADNRRRDGIGPVVMLVIAAAVPAFGFGFLWRWAEARVPRANAQDAVITEPRLPAALTTPLISVRREPETLQTMSSEGTLVAALNAMAPSINDTSCFVVQLGGRTIFTKGATTPVTPASNEKLITAAVALDVLGPDYTYSTRLVGTASGASVTGDMYLVGGGDPLLSSAQYPASVQTDPPTDTTAIEVLVLKLAQAGITRINGNVIADDSRYDTERYVPTWSAAIQNTDAGPLGALMVNDATRQFATPNSPARRYADPALGAATDFIALLKGAGITVGGKPMTGVAPQGVGDLAAVDSVPMSTIVKEMLTTSDDNTAELLLKEIGFHASGAGTRQAGIDRVKAALIQWGIDTTPLNMIDGSGLDSGDSVTCTLLLQVLQHQPVTGPLGVGLPIAAQTGTLAGEFKGSAVDGRLHAKTGTLTNVKALTGFVTTTAGTIDFSLVLDGPGIGTAPNFQPIWDQLAAALGSYPSGPTLESIQPR